jgi:hypothetical protein
VYSRFILDEILTMTNQQLVDNDTFSIATLIYARLRRVSGRLIDAIYLAENKQYALYVITLAEATQDPELLKLSQRLSKHLGLEQNLSLENTQIELVPKEELLAVEPTQEDIERAQGRNRYIGSLR